MMAPFDARARVDAASGSWKDVLPFPIPVGMWVFAFECMRQVDASEALLGPAAS
jgi:hypothetical protein